MKISYYPDTDSLYIDLSEQVSAESREISEGIVLDYDAEGRLVGIDIDNAPQAQANVRAIGGEVASSPMEVAQNAGIVILFLPGPEQVEACVGGEDGLLRAAHAGMVIADMSTVDPGTSERMAQLARQYEVGYLDAPVLGRPAAVGHWALPVGGDSKALERCRPIFELFAAKIFHIGEAGSGNEVKLFNQLMFSAINAMTAEMMAVAEQVGIEPGLLYQTITESRAGQ